MSEYTLVDIWRIRNPDNFSFTWKRHTPRAYARLDYFLIPAGLIGVVDQIDVLPGYKSDHSLIQIILEFEHVDRGQGYWKFNNLLLKNDVFMDKLRIVVDDTIEENKTLN